MPASTCASCTRSGSGSARRSWRLSRRMGGRASPARGSVHSLLKSSCAVARRSLPPLCAGAPTRRCPPLALGRRPMRRCLWRWGTWRQREATPVGASSLPLPPLSKTRCRTQTMYLGAFPMAAEALLHLRCGVPSRSLDPPSALRGGQRRPSPLLAASRRCPPHARGSASRNPRAPSRHPRPRRRSSGAPEPAVAFSVAPAAGQQAQRARSWRRRKLRPRATWPQW
mmetsp:Transcript_132746/g.296986  ORF Transcript_132746/g.296986 Transcript_132746/m.296986 type:complete len:226 (-) Transcript_132746:525-1202(-)